ncbi:MAG TPA: hypothetical protein PLL10_00500 [Elusimicrobiales bacterium]|nr:hypothetical protein [Elusimicrobiales bacterium]
MRSRRIPLLFLLLLPVAGLAQGASIPAELDRRAADCETAVGKLNPDAVRACLKDESFLSQLSAAAPERAALLLSKGQALVQLSQLLDKFKGGVDGETALRTTLSSWLSGLPFTDMNMSEPSQILSWIAQYRPNYSQAKLRSLKKVLLEWDVLPEKDVRQALRNAGSEGEPQAEWNAMQLHVRENVLAAMAILVLDRFDRKGECMSEELRSELIWNFLPPEESERLKAHVKKCAVMEKVKSLAVSDAKLNTEVARLKGESLDVQIYKLSKFFDNSDIPLARELEALRTPTPSETIAPEQNPLLASMLQSSIMGFLRGVPAGDEVASFYAPGSGNEFKLRMEDMFWDTAEYRPASGEIVLNSRLIQQFMRINGAVQDGKFKNFTTSDLLSNKNGAMRHLVNFIAPVIVHEATHQMQHQWASSRKIFDPYSKEDEVEAIAKQSMFMMQKYRQDAAFKKLVDQNKEYSSYMDLNVQLADEFDRDPVQFLQRVGEVYYPKIPPAQSAYAYTLTLLDNELKRRDELSADEREALADGPLSPEDALNMTNSALRENLEYFGTSDLEGLRESILARRKEYVERREQVVADALQAVRPSKP